jgi:hypothetical protein
MESLGRLSTVWRRWLHPAKCPGADGTTERAWVASLLTLFGFVLLESLTSFKIGAYGWIVAWSCVSLIQALYRVAFVVVVKSVAVVKSIANR